MAQGSDRDSLLEEAFAARLLTHAGLVPLCEVIPYPDNLETLGKAQKRGIVLIRAYQDATNPAPTQGARRDKVREVNTVTVELRYLMHNRRDHQGVGQVREFCKAALAGWKPDITHPNYTVIETAYHTRGGLVGRVKGSKRWDYFDAYEVRLTYETRPNQYPKV